MKISQILTELYARLPANSTYLSTTVSISSLTRSSTTVTATCASAHGLSTGDYVTITGALAPIQISSLTQTNGIAVANTTQENDLTVPFVRDASIVGADQSDYNVTDLTDRLLTASRNQFTYTVDNDPVSPATGTILLLDLKERGYNGRQEVTVVDPTTFTYETTETPVSPASGTILAHTGIRLSGAVNLDRAEQSYTAAFVENSAISHLAKPWLFVSKDGMDVSKDRMIENDSVTTMHRGLQYQLHAIDNFSCYLFIPTKADLSGRTAVDAAEDFMVDLYQSILGVLIDSPFEASINPYMITPVGHASIAYNSAYYVHRFVFQSIYDITYQATVGEDNDTVALRDVDINFGNDVLAEIEVDN